MGGGVFSLFSFLFTYWRQHAAETVSKMRTHAPFIMFYYFLFVLLCIIFIFCLLIQYSSNRNGEVWQRIFTVKRVLIARYFYV